MRYQEWGDDLTECGEGASVCVPVRSCLHGVVHGKSGLHVFRCLFGWILENKAALVHPPLRCIDTSAHFLHLSTPYWLACLVQSIRRSNLNLPSFPFDNNRSLKQC